MMQERLVGDAHHRLLVHPVGDEEAGGGECIHQLLRLGARRHRRQRRPPARRGARPGGLAGEADERAHDGGKGGLHRRRQGGEDLLGAVHQGALDTAELAIGGEGEQPAARAALVELLEGELEQGQGARVGDGGVAQHVLEPLAARAVALEAQPGRHRRLADHGADLRRRRRLQVDLPRSRLQRGELRELGEARVEVAAQGGEHPHLAALTERGDGGEETALVGHQPLDGDELLELVDHQHQPRPRWAVKPEPTGERGGRRPQRRADALGDGAGCAAQQRRQLADAGVVGGELGQRLGAQQGGRQGRERAPYRRVVGPHDGTPPEPHALDDSRLGEHWQHAGTHQRRLAATAHPRHHHERPAGGSLLAERVEHLGDGTGAAEEDAAVLELEGLQAAEG